jgi:hypothetical protein
MTTLNHFPDESSNPEISSRTAISAVGALLGLIFALNAASVVAALVTA